MRFSSPMGMVPQEGFAWLWVPVLVPCTPRAHALAVRSPVWRGERLRFREGGAAQGGGRRSVLLLGPLRVVFLEFLFMGLGDACSAQALPVCFSAARGLLWHPRLARHPWVPPSSPRCLCVSTSLAETHVCLTALLLCAPFRILSHSIKMGVRCF